MKKRYQKQKQFVRNAVTKKRCGGYSKQGQQTSHPHFSSDAKNANIHGENTASSNYLFPVIQEIFNTGTIWEKIFILSLSTENNEYINAWLQGIPFW